MRAAVPEESPLARAQQLHHHHSATKHTPQPLSPQSAAASTMRHNAYYRIPAVAVVSLMALTISSLVYGSLNISRNRYPILDDKSKSRLGLTFNGLLTYCINDIPMKQLF
ncbi:MAG: hypothetical protein MHMPM18_000329 [Marteilia pararefringens]